ncbi:hypothetical protein G6F24_018238 [Rhizopus arrhizus]|nr:hypothetical protein G6F24_018238 [Rhizopus arrhizus]
MRIKECAPRPRHNGCMTRVAGPSRRRATSLSAKDAPGPPCAGDPCMTRCPLPVKTALRIAPAMLALLMAAGCVSMAPPYSRPALPVPAAYDAPAARPAELH